MKNPIFYSKQFEINGASIPEFELKGGNLIRIYVPNFNADSSPLGFDITIELIKQFQNQKSNLPWAKNYGQNSITELLNPLTVKKYLTSKMQIDSRTANGIANEIGIGFNERFEHLNFTNKKGLIIKALFEKYDAIIMDYYGVDAMGIGFLEKLVNSEIEKGKAAIAFDRLEFIAEKEPFENIKRVKITVPNNTYN